MLAPHIDQRSLDSKTMVAVKKRTAQHAKLAAFMNAGLFRLIPAPLAFGPSTTGLLRNLAAPSAQV